MADRRTQADPTPDGTTRDEPTREEPTRGDATRRAVIAGAGVLGASALLSACGFDTADLKNKYIADGQTTGAPAAPPGKAASAKAGSTAKAPAKAAPTKAAQQSKAPPADTERLAATSDIPVGGGKIFSAEKVVVIQPTEGTFKAYDTTCPHAGCAVNKIAGGTINCPCHGSKFSLQDASVQAGPSPAPLQEVSIKVEGDSIQLA